jgi:isocitrate dehydrogenase kinase/phosphatase
MVADLVARLRQQLETAASDRDSWAAMKIAFTRLIARRSYWQLAETFFNSVTRRIFATVGVDPNIEFVATEWNARPAMAARPIYRSYQPRGTTAALL